jgi:hypothetical protein
MRNHHQERGEGRLGTLVALTLLAVLIYVAVKFVPVMINTYAFKDFIEQEARFAAVRKDDAEIRQRVLNKARELELPVELKQIRTERTNARFDININYTVPIVTPVYTYNWTLEEKVSSPLF